MPRVGGYNLTGALQIAHLIAPVVTTTSIVLAPIKSRMKTFWITRFVLGKWPLNDVVV